ncbi:flavodoxin [Catenisphaera adipataccumulans]|uniref:Flavodoxin n=1 Tax=Catenisphaera adipataccumulans TaxID=700500 RepID=A0A7W8CZ56_9FIRM|nr:flavodoxin [Catenisphaera adipataccumulans]MBB5182630.1 flavodoxin [Catenisphaera adipataccumulans]
MKRAVIYYSLSGNTEKYAKDLAHEIGADLIKIKMKNPLPNVKWKQFLIGGRQAIFHEKPEIEHLSQNMDQYDEIIIGTPIWAGQAASPINTVLERKEIAEKATAVFTLSGSGNNTKCAARLRKELPNLKTVSSFVDMNNETAKENPEKLRELVKEIQNGEK